MEQRSSVDLGTGKGLVICQYSGEYWQGLSERFSGACATKHESPAWQLDIHGLLVCQGGSQWEHSEWARLSSTARACLASPAVAALLAPPATPAEPQTLLQRCLVADLLGKEPPPEAVLLATPDKLRPGGGAGSDGAGVSAGKCGADGPPAHAAVTPNVRASAGRRDPGSGPEPKAAATPGSISAPARATSLRGLLADLADMCGYGKRGGVGTEEMPSAENVENSMRVWAVFVRILGPAFLCPPALGSAMLKARITLPQPNAAACPCKL